MPDVPDPKTFQAGDFVWPRPPGRVVIYLTGSGEVGSSEEVELLDGARWEYDKERYLARLRSHGNVTTDEALAAAFLTRLTYDEARRLYLGHDTPLTPLGGDSRFPVYVGHVGIIWFENGQSPWVVEAVGKFGVRSISYAAWLAQYGSRAKVWHGRLRGFDPERRAQMAHTARTFVGRPFELWNFDLGDVTDFYCSKLVWLAIRETLAVHVDDNPNARRWFWFSPKQLMHTTRIELLFSPGQYLG